MADSGIDIWIRFTFELESVYYTLCSDYKQSNSLIRKLNLKAEPLIMIIRRRFRFFFHTISQNRKLVIIENLPKNQ